MHARNRTWLLGSDPVERCRQRTLPVEGGDGSTLSLDFTTGVLDPRLTFTRTTNATFINSQGLVQYADANVFQNSETPLSAGWDGPNVQRSLVTITNPLGGTSSVQLQVTNPGSASTILAANLAVGFSYTARVWVRAATSTRVSIGFLVGSFQPSVLSIVSGNGAIQGSGSGSTYHTVTGLTTDWTLLQLVITPVTAGNGAVYIYPNTPTQSAGDSVYIWAPQLNIGTTANPYNRSVANGYYAPRFDYDPITRQTRGLLIEGSANNLTRYSETLEATGGFWGYNEATRTVESSDVNPTGGTGSISFAPTTNGSSRYAGIFLTGQTTASTYTYSVWLKGKGTTQCIISIQNNTGGQNATMTILSQPAGANASIAGNGTGFPRISDLSTTGWTKVQVVLSANLGGTGTLNVFMYPKDTTGQTTSDSIFAWGAQLEAGSGASSYIPTGASQGSRDQDLVSVTLTNFSSWWTSNNPASFLLDFSSTQRPSTNRIIRIADSGGSAFGYSVYFNGSTMPQQVRAVMASASSSDISIGTNLAANTRTKVGFTIETAALKRFRDGSLASTLSSPSLPPNTMTQMYIGGNPAFGNSSADFCLRSFKYWPTTLADATMQILTT